MARTGKKQKELTPEEKLAQALVPVEEQPYPIPENWCWIHLLDSFENQTDSKKKIKQKDYLCQGQLSIVDQGSTLVGGYTNDLKLQYTGNLPVIVFGDHTRCVKYVDFPFAQGADGIKVLSPKDFYCPKAFYYALQSISIPNLGYRRHYPLFKNYSIPVPPLAEQQRIVDRIENLFSKLDEAKEKAQSVIDTYEDRKSAILHQAFSGELTKEWRKQHNVLFSQWENVKLKDCGDWMGGGTPSMSHPEYWENGDILWVTSKDMKADVIDDTLLYVNEKGINNSSANYNEKPSVLFVMRSGILRRTLPIAYIKKPFTVNQDLRAVSPSKIDTKYLFLACKSLEKKMLKTCMKSGTTVESINANALMDFEIPVAPQEEQGVIVEAINELLQKESASKLVAQETVRHVEQMKKAITMKAFRGELETNNPTDEEAEDLLKKIM